jgi:hypothetical protein
MYNARCFLFVFILVRTCSKELWNGICTDIRVFQERAEFPTLSGNMELDKRHPVRVFKGYGCDEELGRKALGFLGFLRAMALGFLGSMGIGFRVFFSGI